VARATRKHSTGRSFLPPAPNICSAAAISIGLRLPTMDSKFLDRPAMSSATGAVMAARDAVSCGRSCASMSLEDVLAGAEASAELRPESRGTNMAPARRAPAAAARCKLRLLPSRARRLSAGPRLRGEAAWKRACTDVLARGAAEALHDAFSTGGAPQGRRHSI
jgi:hypothetical protein